MKPIRTYIILFTLLHPVLHVQASEDWEVNPNLYEFSMTITGVCQSSDTLHEHTADLVIGAFNSEGICVGKSTSRYYASMDKYRIPLLIYGNNNGEKISLKAFFPKFNQVIQILDSIEFIVNESKGNFKDPVIWSLETTPDSITQYEHPLLYPNPARNEIMVAIPGEFINADYAIIDLGGNTLMVGTLDTELKKINISQLASGSYILGLNINSETQTLKFIKF